MSDKVQIDASALSALAQTLNQAASILNAALTNNNVSGDLKKGGPSVNKRGRPKKSEVKPSKQVAASNVEIIDVEEEIIREANEPDKVIQHKPLPAHIIKAKRSLNENSIESKTAGSVIKKNGEIKFLDISNVGDRISADKYPEPTERRNPAKKMSFVCDRCRTSFEMYPTEIPQAFIKEKIPTGGEDKCRVYCDECAGIGK